MAGFELRVGRAVDELEALREGNLSFLRNRIGDGRTVFRPWQRHAAEVRCQHDLAGDEQLLKLGVGGDERMELAVARGLLVDLERGLDVVLAATVQLGQDDEAVARPQAVEQRDLALQGRIEQRFPAVGGGRAEMIGVVDQAAGIHAEERAEVAGLPVFGQDVRDIRHRALLDRKPHVDEFAALGGIAVEEAQIDQRRIGIDVARRGELRVGCAVGAGDDLDRDAGIGGHELFGDSAGDRLLRAGPDELGHGGGSLREEIAGHRRGKPETGRALEQGAAVEVGKKRIASFEESHFSHLSLATRLFAH